jgi:hypothetical protein
MTVLSVLSGVQGSSGAVLSVLSGVRGSMVLYYRF